MNKNSLISKIVEITGYILLMGTLNSKLSFSSIKETGELTELKAKYDNINIVEELVKLKSEYDNVLAQYADTNNDGYISEKEKEIINRDLIKNNNMVWNDDKIFPRYKHNNEIPALSDMRKCLMDYKPSSNIK